MSDTLNQKRQEVVLALISNLSAKNKNDFEACLNAHTILSEMTEQAVTFTKLIQREVVVKLIEASCDITNVN